MRIKMPSKKARRRAQAELIGALIMVGAVLALGMALLSLYSSTSSTEKLAASREVFLARQSSMTLVMGKIDVSPSTKIVILSRKLSPCTLYILVLGSEDMKYNMRYLTPGTDYVMDIANDNSSLVYFNLTAANLTQWVKPTTVVVSSDYVFIKDIRIGETNYGMLTNKIGGIRFVSMAKLYLMPNYPIMIRITLLRTPQQLNIDTLWIKILVQYNGKYYQIGETFFTLA